MGCDWLPWFGWIVVAILSFDLPIREFCKIVVVVGWLGSSTGFACGRSIPFLFLCLSFLFCCGVVGCQLPGCCFFASKAYVVLNGQNHPEHRLSSVRRDKAQSICKIQHSDVMKNSNYFTKKSAIVFRATNQPHDNTGNHEIIKKSFRLTASL